MEVISTVIAKGGLGVFGMVHDIFFNDKKMYKKKHQSFRLHPPKTDCCSLSSVLTILECSRLLFALALAVGACARAGAVTTAGAISAACTSVPTPPVVGIWVHGFVG